MNHKKVYIDPHNSLYENNRFFDLNNLHLNRDDGLTPFFRLKNELTSKGYEVNTFDLALTSKPEEIFGSYYISFGRVRSITLLRKLKIIPLALLILEPPLIDPQIYRELPILSRFFQKVFLHNIDGDCYSLSHVNLSNIYKLYWPQPYNRILPKFWDNQFRKRGVVIVNGNHRPKRLLNKELYTQRIKWSLEINNYIPVSLFGNGWNQLIKKDLPYFYFLKNYFKLQKIYCGPAKSKFETLSRYYFSLCFENLEMDGYITEKIFDCFYTGTIPIYWGGVDILNWIPKNTFIDIRDFKTAFELTNYLNGLTLDKIEEYKNNAKQFLESSESNKYYSLYTSLELNL